MSEGEFALAHGRNYAMFVDDFCCGIAVTLLEIPVVTVPLQHAEGVSSLRQYLSVATRGHTLWDTWQRDLKKYPFKSKAYELWCESPVHSAIKEKAVVFTTAFFLVLGLHSYLRHQLFTPQGLALYLGCPH